MPLRFSLRLRNARAQQIINDLDTGVNHATFQFFTGEMPVENGGVITTQTLVGSCTLSKPCGTVEGGVLTFNLIADDPVADATGVINFARGFDGNGDFVIDGDCGLTDSNAFVKFNNLSVEAGGIIKINNGKLIEGNA